MNDELMREVDDALKQERMAALWKQYRHVILYSCAAIILFAGGLIYWQNHQQELNQSRTASLMQARELYKQKDYAKAKEVLEEIHADAKGPLAKLAGIWLGKTYVQLGENDKAVDAFATAIAGEDKTSFTIYACLQGNMLAPKDERFSSCMPQTTAEPFYPLALEEQAVQLTVDGKLKEASDALSQEQAATIQNRRLFDLSSHIAANKESNE